MKIKAPNTPPGTQAPRVIIAENGYLKLKSHELYTQSFAIGEEVMLADAEEILEDVTYAQIPLYDGDLIEHIEAINAIIEALSNAGEDPGVLEWAPNGYLAGGMVVSYHDYYWEVIQMHWSQVGWEPDKVPALFKRLGVIDTPEEEVPEWVQPTGAHDAYQKGDKVRFEGNTYVSLIDANVHSPAVYPAGWDLL